ncbi:MAG: helix-turn-helix transcriptional regulator [Ignavibacteriota bacterium]
MLSRALQGSLSGNSSPKLSRREQDVIGLLSQRLSNKTIAQQLFISEETLRWHLRNLYTKTGLDTRRDLVEYATTTIQQNQVIPAALNALAAGRGTSE